MLPQEERLLGTGLRLAGRTFSSSSFRSEKITQKVGAVDCVKRFPHGEATVDFLFGEIQGTTEI